jgi:hypothetical protein
MLQFLKFSMMVEPSELCYLLNFVMENITWSLVQNMGVKVL